MAAPWPPQYQQGQHLLQTHAVNAYQQPNVQQQVQQPPQQPYNLHQPHSQHPYAQQPQQYAQQPANYPGYSQQIHTAQSSSQQQQSYQTFPPQQYQFGTQQQHAGHQGFNGPTPQTSVMQYQQYGPPPQHPAFSQPPGQQVQANTNYPQHQQQHQDTHQAFAAQPHAYHSAQPSSPQQQTPQSSIQPQPQLQDPYGPPQPSIQNQPPQSPASPEKDQKQEKKPTVPCFNCGSFEHWAVSCPEPPRAVPAGAINRQNQQPPMKRQKISQPIITKYQVPPHVFQAQNLVQTHQSPPFGHPGFQHPVHYPVPPTPVSAQSSPVGQWPQHLPYAQHQLPPQSGQYMQQPGIHQQYPYTPITTNPVQIYGPSALSQVSPHLPQHVSPVGPPYTQHHYNQGQPQSVQPILSASPGSSLPASAGLQVRHELHGQHSSPGKVYQRHTASASSVHSQTTTPKPQSAESDLIEDTEDDLGTLDVPDLPTIQGASIPTLVGRPLPTNFIVADALAPFAAPAMGDKERCRSKYLDRPETSDETMNVKETGEWEKHKKDPIFNDIPAGGPIILKRVLDMIYRPVRVRDESEGSEADDTEINDHSSKGAADEDERGTIDHLKNSPGDGYKPVEGQISMHRSPQEPTPETAIEDALVSPRVIATAKSVKIPPRPYPPPTPQDRLGDNGHLSRSRSASPRRYGSSCQNISPPDSGADAQPRREVMPIERRDSYDRDHSSRRWSDKPNTQRYEHLPPPPPPPARKPSWYDGPGSSPLSMDTSHAKMPNSSLENITHNGNGVSHAYPPPDNHKTSPLRLRTERSYNMRKEYSHREESSDEDETARRRQADDVTPKLKRRQPKVAEAYSRRW